MTIKSRYILIISIALLTACGRTAAETPNTAAPPATKTLAPFPTFASMGKITFQPTETPSQTPLPTITPWPTETPVTFTPTPPAPLQLDWYILVFGKEGNLYFQDGNNSPVQLTHGGEEPHSPIVSDDNQKIIFVRGDSSDDRYSNLYSVNANGSNEKALITEQWLTALGEGTKIHFPVFVPHTHKLLFNTYLCESQEYNPPCSRGIFLVDANTGEIKEFLFPGKFGQYDHDDNFRVSPNGKMVSVVTSGHIDIFDINSKVIRQDILTYTPSTPTELFPEQYWLPDSSGLVVALPAVIKYGSAFPPRPAYTVSRYTVDNDVALQIPLEPSPRLSYGGCGDVIKVSLDGNSILYVGTDNLSLYIGNLSNGDTQLYKQYACPWHSSYPWNPDSRRFIYGQHYLSSIDKTSVSVPIDGYFLEWVDANHYSYIVVEEPNSKIHIGETHGEMVQYYDLGAWPVLLIKPK